MVYAREFFPCEIPHVENLITIRTKVASHNPAPKNRADVCGSVAIGVIDHKVTAAVHTEYSGEFYQQSRLFPCFTYRCVGRLLSRFENTAWGNPDIFVAMKTQQESHPFVVDCHRSRRQNQQIMSDLFSKALQIRRHWHAASPSNYRKVTAICAENYSQG